MPTLYRQLKKLPWTTIPAVSAVSTDHGRRTRRTIGSAGAGLIGFAGAAQVAQLRRTVTGTARRPSRSLPRTSDRDADLATLAAWVRGHLGDGDYCSCGFG